MPPFILTRNGSDISWTWVSSTRLWRNMCDPLSDLVELWYIVLRVMMIRWIMGELLLDDIKVSIRHFYSDRHQHLIMHRSTEIIDLGCQTMSLEEHTATGLSIHRNCSPCKPEIASARNFSSYEFHFDETINKNSLIINSILHIIYTGLIHQFTNVQCQAQHKNHWKTSESSKWWPVPH